MKSIDRPNKEVIDEVIKRFIKVCYIFLGCAMCLVLCSLLYAQDKDDHLTVKQNVRADSIIFSGNTTAEPSAPLAGELFYNSTEKVPKYFDGTQWQGFGGGSKTAGTKIVAAVNSLDTTRADYVCDGTDDQQEVQQAINDLATIGGAVYLLEGTYNISGSINLDNTAPDDSGKAIIGTGAGTVLKLVSGATNVKVINAALVKNILISQLKIDGNNLTGSGNTGIYFSSVTDSKIDKVWVEDVLGGAGIFIGKSGNPSNNNTICGNNLQGNRDYGLWLASSDNNTISGNNVYNNGNIFNNTSGGILLSASDNNTITGNNIQGNQFLGLGLGLTARNTITGNNVQNNKNDGMSLTEFFNNTITGNNVQNNSASGIWVSGGAWGAANNIISGNSIADNGLAFGSDAIAISSGADTNIFSSNRISDSVGVGYGIRITDTNCDNNYLTGNYIDGAGFKDKISDSGTNTKYTQKEKITIERQAAVVPIADSILNVSTNPKSYVPLAPISAVILNTTTAIADGKAIGDMLILEGGTKTVTIPNNANVKLSKAHGGQVVLGLEDTLKLLWNGTDWIEIGYSDN